MKILVTSIADLKNSEHNRSHQFIKHLSRKHEVTVISIKDWWKAGQSDFRSHKDDFPEIFENIEYIYVTEKKISPVIQELVSGYRVRNVLGNGSIKDGYDVHLNYSTLNSGYAATKKINTVYDIADDLGSMVRSSPQIPGFLRPVGGVVGDWLVKRNIRWSEFITATTQSLLERYKVSADKSKVLQNGVDLKLFGDTGSAKREELGLNGFVIGFVGALREWVDLRPVYRALRDLDGNIRFLVVGAEGQLKDNMKLAEAYGISDRVVFAGPVPYSAVPEYISSMDVCLIPFKKFSVSEHALPLKLFEYMACNRPVISAELLAVRDAAKDCVLYASTSEEYKNKILELYNDESLREHLGKRGRALVESNYDWSKIAAEMEATLSNVAS